MRTMDIREARDRAVIAGMDVAEGVTATGYMLGSYLTAWCVYEGVADMFQPDSPWESNPIGAVPTFVLMAGVLRTLTNVTQSARETLVEHRARRQ